MRGPGEGATSWTAWLPILVGVVLLAAGGWLLASALRTGDATLSYVYRTVPDTDTDTTGSPEAAKAPATGDRAEALSGFARGGKVSTLALTLEGDDRPLATAQVLHDSEHGDVLLAWRSAIAEPVLRSDIQPEEDARLLAALQKHLSAGAVIMAMPVLSRRLALAVDARLPLAAADDSATLIIPAPWRSARDAVLQQERRWLPRKTSGQEVFSGFIDALLADDHDGLARLQALAGGAETHLVLHLRDAFDVGVAEPGRFAVGLRDFPGGAHVHDMTRQVKAWMTEQGHAAYAVQPRSAGVVRAYFLAGDGGAASLLGRLLPFDTDRVGRVVGASLVFQHGGYWVYRIPASGAVNDAASGGTSASPAGGTTPTADRE